MVPGVGNLEPNEQDDDEDEGPETAKDEAWRVLLEEDGSLKPWSEVTLLKPTKVNLGLAMRECMRHAWSIIFLFFYFSI